MLEIVIQRVCHLWWDASAMDVLLHEWSGAHDVVCMQVGPDAEWPMDPLTTTVPATCVSIMCGLGPGKLRVHTDANLCRGK